MHVKSLSILAKISVLINFALLNKSLKNKGIEYKHKKENPAALEKENVWLWM